MGNTVKVYLTTKITDSTKKACIYNTSMRPLIYVTNHISSQRLILTTEYLFLQSTFQPLNSSTST